LGHAHGRDADDRAEMDGQARPSGMIDAGCVHEQHVGKRRQPADGAGEDMALSSRKEARHISGRHLLGRHRLGDDVIGPTRPAVDTRAS
jgi:hypothetical protein